MYVSPEIQSTCSVCMCNNHSQFTGAINETSFHYILRHNLRTITFMNKTSLRTNVYWYIHGLDLCSHIHFIVIYFKNKLKSLIYVHVLFNCK